MGQASRRKWERRAAAGPNPNSLKVRIVQPRIIPKHVDIILTCSRNCLAKHPKIS